MNDIIIEHSEGDYPLLEIEKDVEYFTKHNLNFSPKLVQAFITKVREQDKEIKELRKALLIQLTSITDVENKYTPDFTRDHMD